MKRRVYLTIIWVITGICIFVGSIYHLSGLRSGGSGLNDTWDWIFGGNSFSGNQVTDEVEPDEFSSLDMDLKMMDITIKEGDAYRIRYDCKEKLVPDIKVKDGILTVKQSGKVTKGGNNKCEMVLTVPQGTVLSNMNLSINMGDLDVKNLTVESIAGHMDMGDITLSDCTFKKADISESMGDIDVGDCDLGDAVIELNMGDVDLKECMFESMEITCNTGDVEMDGCPKLSTYAVDLSTNLGDVKVNGKKYKRHYSESADKDDSGRKLTIQNNMGDIKVSE